MRLLRPPSRGAGVGGKGVPVVWGDASSPGLSQRGRRPPRALQPDFLSCRWQSSRATSSSRSTSRATRRQTSVSGREPGPGRTPRSRGDGHPPLSRRLVGWFRVRAEQNLAESVAAESFSSPFSRFHSPRRGRGRGEPQELGREMGKEVPRGRGALLSSWRAS